MSETKKKESASENCTHSPQLYFQLENGRIQVINADFLSLTLIEPGSVDLVVTSPPYNVQIDYGSTDDGVSYAEYLEFSYEWLKKAYELARDDGRLCLNIPLDKSRGREGAGFQPVYVDLVNTARRAGWNYFSTIIWNEGNISRRTAWGSWMSASAPYVIAPVEVVVVFYKKEWRKAKAGKSDITRDEFMEWTNGLWTFPGESKKRVGHPAPFPVELPKRCIKLFSFVGDTVLDPFLGSGTTLIACLHLNRKGIGVELNKQYCQIAKERLIKEFIQKADSLWRKSE